MNYECLACGSRFPEFDQTRSDHRDGKCPSCGYEDIKPVDFLVEKELADLKAMREASGIRG
jgi:predicted Zn-ribbon and HTH transcriptional regulator